MTSSESRDSDYISLAKTRVKALWDALNALEEMQAQWSALDYGTTLPDGIGSNEGLTKTEVGAAIFAGADALRATMNTGVATNFAKML